MKRIVLATLIAAATTSSAFAMTTAGELSTVKRIEVQRLVPGADLTNLSAQQVTAIELFFLNSDNLQSGENPSGKLQKLLERG